MRGHLCFVSFRLQANKFTQSLAAACVQTIKEQPRVLGGLTLPLLLL
jgi:hypothetical protein